MSQFPAGSPLLRIDLCVCTFRREAVCNLLASLGRMILPPGLAVRVIVADNDTIPSARNRVEAAFAAHGLDGIYLHAPDRNISIARNACLDVSTAPLLAFIDDDETARPDWLVRLLTSLDETGADVVFGRVSAIYPSSLPAWLPLADLHSPEPPMRRGVIDGGYTCNVLMRRTAIGACRFNPQFGRSGGEDTAFFAELQARGVVMAYAADAVMEEVVTPQRASLRWLAVRAFRSGQTYGLVRLGRRHGRLRVSILSVVRTVVYLVKALFSLSSAAGWRSALVRACLHGGILASAMGRPPITLYGAAHA
jgi:succinoglycan biosynthesis protein ExoM